MAVRCHTSPVESASEPSVSATRCRRSSASSASRRCVGSSGSAGRRGGGACCAISAQHRTNPAMKKIPTVFRRDPDDMRRVLPEVTPGCEWVLTGEGIATRKYDGTCVMFDGDQWWQRREVKPAKQPPDGWVEVDHDDMTGKRVGWEPAEQGPFANPLAEAVRDDVPPNGWRPGTYELCGPKVQGDPEHFQRHVLVRHEDAERFNMPANLNYRYLRRVMDDLGEYGHEGIVWHHPDGRMAKLKRRDFPSSPTQEQQR